MVFGFGSSIKVFAKSKAEARKKAKKQINPSIKIKKIEEVGKTKSGKKIFFVRFNF